ncbi:MAG: DUF1186 domain-containing protein [Tannerella sp.]|jgi:hypothetical protein|nr:DUF1186 domain-containing protein [Tannerella sp.]
MSKKKKKQSMQPQSPWQYIRSKGRKLPIAECLINEDWKENGMANILIVRQHKSGNYTIGGYLVDTFCLGLKDTFFRFNVPEEEYENIKTGGFFSETSYDELHNIIYGAIGYADDLGICPHKNFEITQYLLAEDTEDVPLIEYEFGYNGKPRLIVKNKLELSYYRLMLAKSTGGNFEYFVAEGSDFDIDDSGGDKNGGKDREEFKFESKEEEERFTNLLNLEYLKAMLKRDEMLPHTTYAYVHPDYPQELTLTHEEVNCLFLPANNDCLDRETIDVLLSLPRESLIRDLINCLMYEIGRTHDITSDRQEQKSNSAIFHTLLLLGELKAEESLAAILEMMRQNEYFFEYHFSDLSSDYIPLTLYNVGRCQLATLLKFGKEPGLYCFLKSYVYTAAAMVAFHEPERRPEVIEWFRNVLNFFYKNITNTAYYEAIVAGQVTCDLLDIHAHELLPEIKRLYDTGMVDDMSSGSYPEVVKEMYSKQARVADYALWNIYERYDRRKKHIQSQSGQGN